MKIILPELVGITPIVVEKEEALKIKTIKLKGVALDWAVALCEGYQAVDHSTMATSWVERKNLRGDNDYEPASSLKYSSNWGKGGPIIERHGICLISDQEGTGDDWVARMPEGNDFCGRTALIAAMRCYVSSKLGDEVEVPDKLVQAAEKEEA